MPVQWRLQEPDGVLVVEGRGVVTDEEYQRAHAEFFSVTARPRPSRRTLADWTDVTELVLSSEAIRASVRMTGEFVRLLPGDHRVALVARAPAVFGMCRMWQTLIEQVGVEALVFEDRDEALAWLAEGANREVTAGARPRI